MGELGGVLGVEQSLGHGWGHVSWRVELELRKPGSVLGRAHTGHVQEERTPSFDPIQKAWARS